MVGAQNIQGQKEALDLLKKGAMDVARKDAEFLQKRLSALQKEMSMMTKLLAATPAHNQGPILRGLEELGDRLKSAGNAVKNFENGRPASFKTALKNTSSLADFDSLHQNLIGSYLTMVGCYTSLGGGGASTISATLPHKKLVDYTA